jgi:hypothetical protein
MQRPKSLTGLPELSDLPAWWKAALIACVFRLVLGDWFDLQGPWSGIDVQETLLFFASQYACFKALPAFLPGKIY